MLVEPAQERLGRVAVLGRLRPERRERAAPGDDRGQVGERGRAQPLGSGPLLGPVLLEQRRRAWTVGEPRRMDEARPDPRIALGDVAVVREHARDATWLSPHGERLRQRRARAVARVDVDPARLDDEPPAVVVEAEVALVERERDRLRLARRRASRARSRAACAPAARCSPPDRGGRAARRRRPATVPVLVTVTDAFTLPFARDGRRAQLQVR